MSLNREAAIVRGDMKEHVFYVGMFLNGAVLDKIQIEK
jgi:hypothetical protein